MRYSYLMVILLIFISCISKRENENSTKSPKEISAEITKDSVKQNLNEEKQEIKESYSIINPDTSSNFRYSHLKTFKYGSYKSKYLKKIDKTYFNNILKQIDGNSYNYDSRLPNFYISKQNSIYDLRLETISLFWDLCYEGIELLIIDRNGKLLNTISLTEWKSTCESTTNTTTTFVSDSVFIQEVNGFSPGGETDFYSEYKYKAVIKESGQIDTLKVFYKKEYEK
nr:hypothetical protein [uncultured Carboxylicivirga sp.]